MMRSSPKGGNLSFLIASLLVQVKSLLRFPWMVMRMQPRSRHWAGRYWFSKRSYVGRYCKLPFEFLNVQALCPEFKNSGK